MSVSAFRYGGPSGGTTAAKLAVLQSAGLALGCFAFAAIFEGSHPGEAAVAATAVAGAVSPSGADSIAGEIGSGISHLRVYATGLFSRLTGR